MKISEVIQQTGLSKRCIHNYIEEGLITPDSNPQNGYKIFTQQDVTKLCIIKKLRELDFPLSGIRSVLKHPNTLNYYLYLQLKKETQAVQLHQNRMEAISVCIEKMPLGITMNLIAEHLSDLDITASDAKASSVIEPKDAQLILTFMWGMFIVDFPMTEYRQYLWNKLAEKLCLPENKYLLPVKEYFYSCPIEHVEAQFAIRNLLIDRVAHLDASDRDAYVEEMKITLADNLNDVALIQKWKTIYHSFIKPTSICADSTAHELLSEFCPRFADYCININYCCDRLLRYLNSKEGNPLLQKILHTLNDYIDIEASHSGELAALACFRETI